ncbi:MAG TPA: hypothetical protein ENH95_02965 [Nitrosopumilus sp.]|nr:hypothetical protein [Nitrosopumilus sp.]
MSELIENPIFLSVSGSHLFGIPKPGDIDIRGAHALTKKQFWTNWQKTKPKWVIEYVNKVEGLDLVSHEVGAYLKEIGKPNVNFIEQVLSPMRIVRSKWYDQIQDLARDCVSKTMYSHWKGFAMHTSYHAVKEDYKKAKRNLYLLRIYYQGIYVARNEMVKSSFEDFKSLDVFNDSLVQELFDCKRRKADFFNKQNFLTHCAELEKQLQVEISNSKIRDAPSVKTKEEINELVREIYEETLRYKK